MKIFNWLKKPKARKTKRNPYTSGSAAAIIWNKTREVSTVTAKPKTSHRPLRSRKPAYDLRKQAATKT